MRRVLVVIYEVVKMVLGSAIVLLIFGVIQSASGVFIVEVTRKPIMRWLGPDSDEEDLYFVIVGIVSFLIAGIFLLGIVQLISLLKKGRAQ